MAVFSGFDKSLFLQDYWQQKPLFLRQSLPACIDMIAGDDLAGLSCEEDVESRIISGHGLNNNWHCQQGPFSEQDFAGLPAENWTLLVQGLDQWSEEIYRLLDAFDFLPRWRLEDIMASYAPSGGGVGPHFDYYDVFLIQVSGTRQWHLGQQCDDQSPLQPNHQVKLLADFYTSDRYQALPGDLLYIPAGLAHWGTAVTDNCITLSVGFRAPSEKELLTATLEHLVDQWSENKRYRDTELSIDAHPYKINQGVHQHLLTFLQQLSPQHLQSAVNQAFGQLVTEPRYSADIDAAQVAYGRDDLLSLLGERGYLSLALPPSTRLAFSEAQLFVNGEAFQVSTAFAQAVCEGRIQQCDQTEAEILVNLLKQGDIDLLEDS